VTTLPGTMGGMDRPAPIPTPADHAAAYRGARERITDLVTGISPAQAALVVPSCPDWTVQQLCCHLAGVCADLVGRRGPTGDTQAWVDGQVAERAGRSVEELMTEWASVSPAFEELIERKPAGFAGLAYDVIVHEHDLRATLGRPGDRSHADVVTVMETQRALLGRDLTAHGLPAVELRADGMTWIAGEGTPGLVLDLGDRPDGTWHLLRILGSRRSRAQLATEPWQGDWEAFIDGLAHMPLPASDLVE
jgi:uncharacterized protein (TIGR03083 family)